MICDEPGCTGVHKTSRPHTMWCPRTIARVNERKRERYAEDLRTRLLMSIRMNNYRNRKDQEVVNASAKA